MTREDLTGRKFGRLTVISYERTEKGVAWKCQCDCGNMVYVKTAYLTNGDTKSCGCLKHKHQYKDITGQRFGRLVVKEYDHTEGKTAMWKCECDCGNTTVVCATSLKRGLTSSCGCLFRELARDRLVTHGECHTRLYKIWRCMKRRCGDLENEYYGARGIKVCEVWSNDFISFREWALANGYNDKLSIDRIDPNQGYYPENCRWADDKMQCRNRRSNRIIEYNGERHCISEWAEITGINEGTLYSRLYSYGWSVEKALTTPVKTR